MGRDNAVISGISSSEAEMFDNNEELELQERGTLKTIIYGIFEMARKLIKSFFGLLFNHRYHIDDIINIFRPFIFVYLVMKHGRKSYEPIKISLLLDMISILISFSRLIQASNPEVHRKTNDHEEGGPKQERSTKSLKQLEKRELRKRIWNLLIKYLIRDPIFQDYTQPIVMKIFTTLRFPQAVYGLIFGILSYFRYYSYIA